MAYLIPDMRLLELVLGLACLPFLPLWVILPESPRWLLAKGRNEEAVEVLRKIARINKKSDKNVDRILDLLSNPEPVTPTVLKNGQKKENQNSDKSPWSALKYPGIRRNFFLMNHVWFCFSIGYYGLIYNAPTFGLNVHLVFIFPVLFILPYLFIAPILENSIGRKMVTFLSLLLAGERRKKKGV